MYADAYLAQTDGAYSDAPGPDHAAVPLAVCPFWLFGSVRWEVVGHQRCAGWLQGLSFLVVCWEGVGYQRCVGWLQGLSFLVVCREGMGIGAVVDALWGECGIGAVVDAVE